MTKQLNLPFEFAGTDSDGKCALPPHLYALVKLQGAVEDSDLYAWLYARDPIDAVDPNLPTTFKWYCLGPATSLDRILWDKHVVYHDPTALHFDVLHLFTPDVLCNILVEWSQSEDCWSLQGIHSSYQTELSERWEPYVASHDCDSLIASIGDLHTLSWSWSNVAYWALLQVSPHSLKIATNPRLRGQIGLWNCMQLEFYQPNAPHKTSASALFAPGGDLPVPVPPDMREHDRQWDWKGWHGGQTDFAADSWLVPWRRLAAYTDTMNDRAIRAYAIFERFHSIAFHPWHRFLRRVPLIDRHLFKTETDACDKLWHNHCALSEYTRRDSRKPALIEKPYHRLYNQLCKRANWVNGVGQPMVANLDQLSSILLDVSEKKTTLVTGFPGTGKEAYAKAIHYTGRLAVKHDEKSLVIVTALGLGANPCCALKTAIAGIKGWRAQGDSLTIFIDELNKADAPFRSQLLRVLENAEDELELKKRNLRAIRFVLAASDPLQEIGQQPPQDFWTRITHQLRVAHPLRFVAERDAEQFLESFFWSEWLSLVQNLVDVEEDENKRPNISAGGARLQAELIGAEVSGLAPDNVDFKLDPTAVGAIAYQEFVDTLTPLASRGDLSIRGAKAIVGQMFSRAIWASHTASIPLWARLPSLIDAGSWRTRRIGRAASSAIQDVLAIQNAASATPRSVGDEKGAASDGGKRG